MKKYALISTGLMLSGCLVVSPVVSGSLPTGAERLYALSFTADHIEVRVKSFGCTKVADFAVQVDKGNALTIIRNKEDRCRAMPRLVDLQLTRPEMPEGDVFVKNPFAYQP